MLDFLQSYWAPIFFLAASLGVWRLSVLTGDRYAIWISAMLGLSCLAFNALELMFPLPAAWSPLPFADTGCLVVCAGTAITTRAIWPRILAILFALELVLHVAFWTSWVHLGLRQEIWGPPPLGHEARMAEWRLEAPYAIWLDVIFFLQLLVAAWPGAKHVFGAHHDRMRGGLPLPRRGGA